MKMIKSCNGCRALRKGCSEDCTLRPCLLWLNSPDAQANATAFLAKFYGRTGLFNLINAAPSHLRPDTFRSLLYEACGRIINPVHGAAGLLASGNWPRCHAAVEVVLRGGDVPCDIRHISNDHRVVLRNLPASWVDSAAAAESEARFTITGWGGGVDRKDFVTGDQERRRAPSHDSISVATVEPRLTQPESRLGEVGLELSLGRNPVQHTHFSAVIEISDREE